MTERSGFCVAAADPTSTGGRTSIQPSCPRATYSWRRRAYLFLPQQHFAGRHPTTTGIVLDGLVPSSGASMSPRSRTLVQYPVQVPFRSCSQDRLNEEWPAKSEGKNSELQVEREVSGPTCCPSPCPPLCPPTSTEKASGLLKTKAPWAPWSGPEDCHRAHGAEEKIELSGFLIL